MNCEVSSNVAKEYSSPLWKNLGLNLERKRFIKNVFFFFKKYKASLL